MSIRGRVASGFILSFVFALLAFFLIAFASLYTGLKGKIEDTSEGLRLAYRELVKREKERLKNTPLFSSGYYWQRLEKERCEESPYYHITASGVYYGVERTYEKGCVFAGVRVYQILDLLENLMKADWLVYYQREFLLEPSVANKVVLGGVVIDAFSRQDMLELPVDFKGYMVYGSLLEKYLLVEVPLLTADGTLAGRVVLAKDLSPLYREFYSLLVGLLLFCTLLGFSVGFVLYRTVSNIIDRIAFLKKVISSLEKNDFSVINLLENLREKSPDELYGLIRSIHSMAVSLMLAFEELEKKKAELEELAYYDPLTGLPNRRLFFSQAELLLENAKRYGNPLSLLVMDLDDFKKINDTYGHEAGDLVLKSFAQVLKGSIRKSDLPARTGGEEFVVFMPNTDLEQGKLVAHRIRTNLKNSLVVYRGKEIRVTLSGGLASIGPDVNNIDDLIRKADEALYRAKALGKDRIEVYED